MRTHTARPHKNGGWHYVSMSSHGGHPLGYCAHHPTHPTEQEARECYQKFQIDNIQLDGKLMDWTSCDVPGCGLPTKKIAKIKGDGFHMAALCDEHLTKEYAIQELGLLRPAGDSWVS